MTSKVDTGARKEAMEFCGAHSSVTERDVVALKHTGIGDNYSHLCRREEAETGIVTLRAVYVVRHSKTENGLELFTTFGLSVTRKSAKPSKTEVFDELSRIVKTLNPPVNLTVTESGKPEAGGSMMVVPEETPPEKPQESEPPPAPKKLERRKTAVVGREAAEWKPYPVKKIGGGNSIRTTFLRQVRKIKVKVPAAEPAEPPPEGEAPKENFTISYKGKPAKSKAVSRSYKLGERRLLILSLYPKDLKTGRIHLELRFTVDEGFLQEAKIAGVRILGDIPAASVEKWDSRLLRRAGIEFEEFAPSDGRIEIAHLDPLPGARSFNAGKVFLAQFGDKELGSVNFTYSVSGAQAP